MAIQLLNITVQDITIIYVNIIDWMTAGAMFTHYSIVTSPYQLYLNCIMYHGNMH